MNNKIIYVKSNKETGEICVNKEYLKKIKINKIYYIKYDYCPMNNKKNNFLLGRLINNKNYSYTFDDFYHSDYQRINKKCKLSIPKYWVETVDLSILTDKIPYDILLEIIKYIF